MIQRVIRLSFCALMLSSPALWAQSEPSAPAAAQSDTSAQVKLPAQLPDHLPTLQALSLQTFQNQQYADFVRILEHARKLRPDDPQLMVQLVSGYALTGQKAAAYTLMIQMQRQGLAVDFDQIPQTESIRSTQVYEHITKLMKDASQAYGFADTEFTLPADLHMPEALAWDEKNQQWLVGDVRNGKIRRFDAQGQEVGNAPFATDGLWGVFGLAVDSERGLLWASTTAVGQFIGFKTTDYGQTALVAFDLTSGAVKHSYKLVPDGQPHGLGSISLGADGTVYVADSRQPTLHVLKPDAKDLERLFSTPALTSIRGMSYSAKNRLLYIADRELGIMMWSEQDQQLYRLHKPDTLNLSGAEGLAYWEDHLVLVQNGINPERVIQIRLAADGRAIEHDAPLAANLEKFDGPSYGTVRGQKFYFFAANHWPAFDLQGNRLPGTNLNPVPVLSLPLAPLEKAPPPKLPSAPAQ